MSLIVVDQFTNWSRTIRLIHELLNEIDHFTTWQQNDQSKNWFIIQMVINTYMYIISHYKKASEPFYFCQNEKNFLVFYYLKTRVALIFLSLFAISRLRNTLFFTCRTCAVLTFLNNK